MEAVHCCVDREKCVFRLWFCRVHVHCVLPQRLNFHDMKRGLSDSNQHGNNGVDRPARLSRACFSLNQSFALTSISLRERPFLYEMSGFPV